MGMDCNERIFIPLKINGSTCGFVTRYLTDTELETSRHITLSDEDDWDPSKKHYDVSSIKAEK